MSMPLPRRKGRGVLHDAGPLRMHKVAVNIGAKAHAVGTRASRTDRLGVTACDGTRTDTDNGTLPAQRH
jgi:hypothetical protein